MPEANPAARLAYSPAKLHADPGIPGPRRPTAAPTAAIAAVIPSRAAASA